MLDKVVDVFDKFKHREWLAWGSKIMPELAEVVAEEEAAERAAERARQVAAAEARLRAEKERFTELERRMKEVCDDGVRLRRQVGQDLLAKKIDKGEMARRIAVIDTEVEQRLSALQTASDDGAAEEKKETTGPSGTEGTSREAGLRAPKVPTKRKSDDSLGELRAVTGKVSRASDLSTLNTDAIV